MMSRENVRRTLQRAWVAMVLFQMALIVALGLFLALLACVGNVWFGGGALNA